MIGPLARFEMDPVLLVLITDGFQDVAIRKQYFRDLNRERSGVHLGILDGHAQVHMAEIAPLETLLNSQLFAVRMSEKI